MSDIGDRMQHRPLSASLFLEMSVILVVAVGLFLLPACTGMMEMTLVVPMILQRS